MADTRLIELFNKLQAHYGSYEAAARALGVTKSGFQKMRTAGRVKLHLRVLLEFWDSNPKQYDEAVAALREGRPIKWLIPPFLVERLERLAGHPEQ